MISGRCGFLKFLPLPGNFSLITSYITNILSNRKLEPSQGRYFGTNFELQEKLTIFFETSNSEPLTLAQRMKLSINDDFSKYDQIHRNLQFWSHLLKKSILENFIFCAV